MTSEPSKAGHPALSGKRRIAQKLKQEAEEWFVMFIYLWVIFGLFALHESILRAEQHQNYRLQGFAIINALILSKVMLVGEGLRLARGRGDSRAIMIILKRSFAFALLFIAFHVLESIIVGVAHGKSIAASFPDLAGGHLMNIIALGIIVSVCLVPYFAFREVSRELGEDRLWRLLVARHERSD
jgi:membrane protein CcdC involved in cytochrome C biogenesis